MFEQTFRNIDDILHKDAGCTSELALDQTGGGSSSAATGARIARFLVEFAIVEETFAFFFALQLKACRKKAPAYSVVVPRGCKDSSCSNDHFIRSVASR